VPPLVARAFGGMLTTLLSIRGTGLRRIGFRRSLERCQQRIKVLAKA
jgi:hypothetical protein